MNRNYDIEELLEAEKRVRKDSKRQQELCDMVDQWATQESEPRRTPLWLWGSIGAAACFLILFSIGLKMARHETSNKPDQTIVAKAQPANEAKETVLDEPLTGLDNSKISQPKKRQHHYAPKQHIVEETAPVESEPLLAEVNSQHIEEADVSSNTTITNEQEIQEEEQPVITEVAPTVYQRSSTKLVANNHSKSTNADNYKIKRKKSEFFDNKGTGTYLAFGNIPF